MKLKMTEGSEKYGVPKGIYRAKFLGAKEDTHPEYGAGLKWEFEVTEGPFAGKIAGRTTSPAPTLKNGCGKMVQMLAGGIVSKNDDVDLDQYVGKVYQIMVEDNSTGTGTRIGSAMPIHGAAPAQPASPAAPRPTAPPPTRPAPPKPATIPMVNPELAAQSARLAAHYWVEIEGKDVEEMTGQQLQLHVNAAKESPKIDAIGVMNHDQSSGWRTPTFFGFTPEAF